ncbi:hypothetical protein TRICI_000778 [Trichomonascus ciferrii]|uniref:Uncharacterized protein n=1 Tax=Trichomonascus ciferrii TaxID=44093 RepID=A0A642VBZ9_9ASCO|nr:hypothetical protein TRICI_000778 [Trichomonascus ciferrii]
MRERSKAGQMATLESSSCSNGVEENEAYLLLLKFEDKLSIRKTSDSIQNKEVPNDYVVKVVDCTDDGLNSLLRYKFKKAQSDGRVTVDYNEKSFTIIVAAFLHSHIAATISLTVIDRSGRPFGRPPLFLNVGKPLVSLSCDNSRRRPDCSFLPLARQIVDPIEGRIVENEELVPSFVGEVSVTESDSNLFFDVNRWHYGSGLVCEASLSVKADNYRNSFTFILRDLSPESLLNAYRDAYFWKLQPHNRSLDQKKLSFEVCLRYKLFMTVRTLQKAHILLGNRDVFDQERGNAGLDEESHNLVKIAYRMLTLRGKKEQQMMRDSLERCIEIMCVDYDRIIGHDVVAKPTAHDFKICCELMEQRAIGFSIRRDQIKEDNRHGRFPKLQIRVSTIEGFSDPIQNDAQFVDLTSCFPVL